MKRQPESKEKLERAWRTIAQKHLKKQTNKTQSGTLKAKYKEIRCGSFQDFCTVLHFSTTFQYNAFHCIGFLRKLNDFLRKVTIYFATAFVGLLHFSLNFQLLKYFESFVEALCL